MIANSEINQNGIILSHPFLVGSAGLLKNELPLLPYLFLKILLNLRTFEKGVVR